MISSANRFNEQAYRSPPISGTRPPESLQDPVRGLFLSLVCVLAGFGVLMVHSASLTSWPGGFEQIYLTRHFAFLGLGIVVAVVCSVVPVRFWFRSAPVLFSLTVVLLLLVLAPGVGSRVNGARRWLRFGPLSLQPSELAKIVLPMFLCRLACARLVGGARSGSIRTGRVAGFIAILAALSVLPVLVLLQPDLGTAVFLAGTGCIALFAAGWPKRKFLLAAVCCLPPCLLLGALKPYQVQRITSFVAGLADPDDAHYQVKQSLVTLGAGGAAGVGPGKGWQKLSFLPEANTDFVFAVVGEELGLAGTLAVLALWSGIYITGLRLLSAAPRQSFAAVLGFTLLTQLVVQAGLNVAIVVGLLPPKGIPHPLLSYGGSNLVVSFAALGIVIGLSRNPQPANKRRGTRAAGNSSEGSLSGNSNIE